MRRRARIVGCALSLACDAVETGPQRAGEPALHEAPVPPGGREGGAADEARSAVPDRRAACLARNADAPARYARIVRAFCAEHHNLAGIGASLAIAEDGELRLIASAGRGCLEGQDVSASTRFRIGSITKLLTAALVLRLVDAGRVRLDEAVVRALPELAAGVDDRAARITWRHLLTHTAGLPDPAPLELQAEGADWLQALGERPLWREPGALWSYSSDGYAVAGAALERLTGQTFERLLAERVLAPLGQAGVTVDPQMALETGAACGHLGRGAAALELSVAADLELGAGDARWAAPAGGAIASAPELALLALGLVDPGRSPLSLELLAELLRAEVPTGERPGERYGLGVRARDLADGSALFAHAGNSGDFAADLYFEPGRGFALVLLANSGDHLRATAAAALQELLGAAPEPAGPAAPTRAYVGTYASREWGAPVVVRARGEGLGITAPDLWLAGAALEHAGDHRFRVAGRPELGSMTFVFMRGAERASDLRGRVFVGARVE